MKLQCINRKTEHFFFFLILSYLIALGLFLSPSQGQAKGIEGWKGDSVQDETGLTSPAELDRLREEIKSFPVPVKVLITAAKADADLVQMGKTVFSTNGLKENEMLILASSEGTGISVTPGPALEKGGLTPEKIKEKIDGYYLPQAKQGEKISGIIFFLREIKNDIKVPPLDSPAEAASTTPGSKEEGKATSSIQWGTLSFMLFLLAVIALFIYVYLQWRKRLIARYRVLIERKEALKKRLQELKLTHPIRTHDEGSHLRKNSMQKIYEDYKERLIPSVEEELKEAEARLSRYRLFSIGEILHYVDHSLQDMGEVLDQFQQAQEGLVRKEKEIPLTIMEGERLLSSLKKSVNDLSSRFGVNLSSLKELIASLELKLKSFKERLKREEENFPKGEMERCVTEMRELIERIEKSEAWVEEMEELLPNRIKALEQELKELHSQGSVGHHEQLVAILKESKEIWNSLISLWDEGDLATLEERIRQVKMLLNEGEKIITLEQEARSQIVFLLRKFEERTNKMEEGFQEDLHLLEKLRRKYQLEGDPILDEKENLRKELDLLQREYQEILSCMEREEYAEAYERAKSLYNEVKRVEEQLFAYHQRVSHLSLEEEVYSQEIKRLRSRLLLLRQQLDRSLLPGKQEELYRLIQEGQEMILGTEVLFDQLPIHLHKIAHRLEETKEMVAASEKMILTTIEHAKETEEIIRNLNIYRYQDPQIGQLLMMAENSYRDNNFTEAVEHARKAKELLHQRMDQKKRGREPIRNEP
ncbi:septation ring formation regulator EzrA [Thermicanus aegyptius]|uniref:septation ring formation regulator EzrA n=1 Tax=Thermicanus aegyptius TaxID=94009 RepID=UPI000416B76C|nr:septation ring formation regulator EzrA [Thermicanus aegyptius]